MSALAKNKSFASFSDININIDEKKEKKFLHGADMTSTKKTSKAGRKKKEDKAKYPRVVYFTEEQAKVIDDYCSEIPIQFSPLMKQLLKDKGIL